MQQWGPVTTMGRGRHGGGAAQDAREGGWGLRVVASNARLGGPGTQQALAEDWLAGDGDPERSPRASG